MLVVPSVSLLCSVHSCSRSWRKAACPASSAWYDKRLPTFSDALALVRKDLWAQETFRRSLSDTDTVKVPRAFVERLTEAVCYAA